MKNFISEFKTFILRGNALELAIGVVIGTAFNTVVNSLVKDIILGTFATFTHKTDLSALSYGAIQWGSFLNSLINLLVIGLTIFIVIKAINKISGKEIVNQTNIK